MPNKAIGRLAEAHLGFLLWVQWLRWCLSDGHWQVWRLDDDWGGAVYDVRWSKPLFGLHFHLAEQYDMRGAATRAWDLNTSGKRPWQEGAGLPTSDTGGADV